jgi:GntR family transcriptional regulator
MPRVAPPYQRVAAEIHRRIVSGEWPPGHQLPSRAKLAAELGTTEAAVRLGMALLRRRGELEGTQRTRLWVAHPPAVRTLLDPDRDWPYRIGDGALGSCRADADLAARLQVPVGSRLRWRRDECLDPDSRPSHLITTWWRGTRAVRWARCDAEAQLHQLTAVEAEHLGLPEGVPAWLIQRTRIAASGEPAETADMVLPADRWRIRLR